MTNEEKKRYLLRMQNAIYPSKNELLNDIMKNVKPLNGEASFFCTYCKGTFLPIGFFSKGCYGRTFLVKSRSGSFYALKISRLVESGDKDIALAELELNEKRKKYSLDCLIPYLDGTTKYKEARVAEIDDSVQFVMPVGLPFDSFIKKYLNAKGYKMNESETLFIMYRMFSNLKKIHERNILHRDLKPENMLLVCSSSGSVQLVFSDFGTSKSIGHSGLVTKRGTPAFRPLSFRDEREGILTKVILTDDIAKKVDVYALGIVTYMILDGDKIETWGKDGDLACLLYHDLFVNPEHVSKPKYCPSDQIWDLLKRIIHNTNDLSKIPTAKEVCRELDAMMFPSQHTSPAPTRIYQPFPQYGEQNRQPRGQGFGGKKKPKQRVPQYGEQHRQPQGQGFGGNQKPKQHVPQYGEQHRQPQGKGFGGNQKQKQHTPQYGEQHRQPQGQGFGGNQKPKQHVPQYGEQHRQLQGQGFGGNNPKYGEQRQQQKKGNNADKPLNIQDMFDSLLK